MSQSGGSSAPHRSFRRLAALASSRRRTGVVMGAARQQVGIGPGLCRGLQERVGHPVEGLHRLGLGRLDHHGLVDHEREVDRRRVVPEVDEALGDVHRADARLPLQRLGGRDELVHRGRIGVGERERRAEARREVVGVERGELAHVGEPVASVAEDVGVGTNQYRDVSVEAVQAPDRAGTVTIPPERAVVVAGDDRGGQVRRPGASPPPRVPRRGLPRREASRRSCAC